MNIITRTVVLLMAALISCSASAARLSIGEQSGNGFDYDKAEEYVSISLKELNLPSIDDDSSQLARFFKRLFVDRKRYGVAYIEVTPAFGDKEKTILFTYEKESDDRYKYKYIGASSDITYSISRPFIYSDPVDIHIIIKEWEDEKSSSAVKTILGAVESSGASTGHESVLSNITLMLDLIEALFPADSSEEALSLRLSPADIHKEDIQVNGDDAAFFKLTLRSRKAFFDDYDTDKGIQRVGIGNMMAWKQVITTADKNIPSDGLEPLISAVQSYADYVSTLNLNRRDQAILTACSINDWANDAVKGNVTYKNQKIQFTAHDYSKLPTANLKIVRNSSCDFTGVNCNTSHCLAMSDFINKSSRSTSRRTAAELYIDGELNISFKDGDLTLKPEDYISSFRISRPAFFETEPTGPNSWSYYFSENALDLRIDGRRYKPYKIRIDLVREKTPEDSKYVIVGIEIDAMQAVSVTALGNP
jgi:hypothetical protein